MASGSGRLIGVRGRRQVGKSRLVEHFAERSGVPYGVVAGMKGTPARVQLGRAVDTLRASLRPLPALDAVTAVAPADWYELLARLRIAGTSSTPTWSPGGSRSWSRTPPGSAQQRRW